MPWCLALQAGHTHRKASNEVKSLAVNGQAVTWPATAADPAATAARTATTTAKMLLMRASRRVGRLAGGECDLCGVRACVCGRDDMSAGKCQGQQKRSPWALSDYAARGIQGGIPLGREMGVGSGGRVGGTEWPDDAARLKLDRIVNRPRALVNTMSRSGSSF
jgi:hypothetical protein